MSAAPGLGRGAVDPAGGLVGTPPVMAGFGGGSLPRPAVEAPDGEPAGLEVAAVGFSGDAGVRHDPRARAARVGGGGDLLLVGGVDGVGHGGARPAGGGAPTARG